MGAIRAYWNELLKGVGSDGKPEPVKITSGAAHVAEVGIPAQRHNRLVTTDVTATHPGNDTTAVTWTQAENVRRYRVLALSATATDKVKIVEDAINGTQALAWLSDETESLTADVEWWMIYVNQWSEWKELSKDAADQSLSRLDFELFTGGTGPITEILVEAE